MEEPRSGIKSALQSISSNSDVLSLRLIFYRIVFSFYFVKSILVLTLGISNLNGTVKKKLNNTKKS